jgi:hypothetical protein
MQTSNSVKDIATALTTFQSTVPPIKWDSKVEVETNKGYRYTFNYASMRAINEAIAPALKEAGLAVVQTIGMGELTTALLHVSGEFISSSCPLVFSDHMSNQDKGSVVTYMRRYSLAAILGLVTDDDDDANKPDGNAIVGKTQPQDTV